MANKFDLTKLEDLADGFTSESVTLSPETVFLCVMALDDRTVYRGAWVDDDGTISNSRWDEAVNLVEQAKEELMGAISN